MAAAGTVGTPQLARAFTAADSRTTILLNHVGFTPSASKVFLVSGTSATSFSVTSVDPVREVFRGDLEPRGGDLGTYLLGDFSKVNEIGTFRIRLGDVRSEPFTIAPDVYLPAVRLTLDYFAKQRCGDSKTSWLGAPCHLDDGRRNDDGKRLDVTGGWHDACDLRKWVDATIYGMIGLSRMLELLGPQRLDASRVIDELRWGNRYFLNMQDPAGFVMNYCGGDDGNNFTDNRAGTDDDRSIHVEPAELPGQFHFVSAQAAVARLTRDIDPKYADRCLQAGLRCMDWCMTKRAPRAATSLAAGVIAAAQLHRTSGEGRWRDQAADYARKLLELQVVEAAGDGPRGFFRARPDDPEPLRDPQHGNLPLIALCEALERFAADRDAPAWERAVRTHTSLLTELAERSAFGTVPYGLYADRNPGGGRRIGAYGYRYFMRRHGETTGDPDWWVGINAHLASNGVGLSRAARLLRDPHLSQLAQRQLDWILGLNPFDASTMSGVGRNHPGHYKTGAFKPSTPVIAGGVMNGIGGTDADQPTLDAGSYNTCEYWTPMVSYAACLMCQQMGEIGDRAP